MILISLQLLIIINCILKSPALRAPRPVNKIVEDNEPTITGFTGNVSSKYTIETKVLGEGHYGTVRRCQDRETGEW